MNIRKSADYGKLFQSLSEVMERGLGQMELYCEIGKLVAISDDNGLVRRRIRAISLSANATSRRIKLPCSGCAFEKRSMDCSVRLTDCRKDASLYLLRYRLIWRPVRRLTP